MSLYEYTIDGTRACSHDIFIHHHVRHTAIAIVRVGQVVVHHSTLFLIFQPVVPGHPGIMLVDLPVASLPVVELTGVHADPVDESTCRQLSGVRPLLHEVHDRISEIWLYPPAAQSSPFFFFAQ